MPSPIPILSVGAREEMGRFAIKGMKPEYEVIHFVLGHASLEEVPLLLQGKVPASPSSSIGTGNWAVPPKAIIIGGAFTPDKVAEMKAAVSKAEGARKIPWLGLDGSKPRPEIAGNEQGYMDAITKRFKEALAQLEKEGRLDKEGDDFEVYFA